MKKVKTQNLDGKSGQGKPIKVVNFRVIKIHVKDTKGGTTPVSIAFTGYSLDFAGEGPWDFHPNNKLWRLMGQGTRGKKWKRDGLKLNFFDNKGLSFVLYSFFDANDEGKMKGTGKVVLFNPTNDIVDKKSWHKWVIEKAWVK